MKRWTMMLVRVLFALALVVAGAGAFTPSDAADAGFAYPDALRTGDLPAAWRWVDSLGRTGEPYPGDIQGDHINRPNGMALDSSGRFFLVEEWGKRLRGFTDTDFNGGVTTPAISGVNDPFWNPRHVVRNHNLTWVIDSHHLVVLDNSGAVVQDLGGFTNPDPSLGWARENFNCADGLAFDPQTDLLYVFQNCGNNPVLVLQVETPAVGDYFPDSLTLVDAFNLGDWYKLDIEVADLNADLTSEVYISGDNGIFRCNIPASMPGAWNCSQYAGGTVSRGRGLFYSQVDSTLYLLNQVDWDWQQSGLYQCDYDGNCASVAVNGDFQNTPNLTFNDPQDLIQLPSGNFYITDAAFNVVARLSNDGGLAYTPVYGVQNEGYVTADGYFNNPVSVVVDAEDNLYVAEQNGRRILSFDAAGSQRWVWGVPGAWNNNWSTEICQPQGSMAIDPAGNLYVADRCSGRIVMLSKDTGAYLTSFTPNGGDNNEYGFNGPAGVAVSNSGRMFVLDPDNHRVQEYRYTPYAGWSHFSTLGIPLSWPNPSTADGAIMDPTGVAVNGDSEVYIADQSYNRVQKCTRADSSSAVWSCANLVGMPNVWGNSNYLLQSPQGLALDTDGRLYVADNNSNRVQVFDSADGSYLGTIGAGEWGDENIRLSNPLGVALDSAGNVYVAESGNHRVSKFMPSVPSLEYLNQMGGISYGSYRAGDTLYTGYGNRLVIYDLSDPEQPVRIGQTQALSGSVQDVVVSGGYAYVASVDGGLMVVDVSTPAAPLVVRELLTPGNPQALALDQASGSLFVLQNGPTLVSKFNLSNPAAPVFDSLHWIDNYSRDIAAGNDKVYVSVERGPGVVIELDGLDLNNSGEANILDTAQVASLTLDGAMLYAADPGYGLYQIDTSAANTVASLSMDPAPVSTQIQGEFAFAHTTNYGQYAAVQIAGTNLTLAGQFNISQWRETSDALAVGLSLGGDPLLYISARIGLSTYAVDTTGAPFGFTLVDQETADFGTGWQSQMVGDTLYVTDLGRFDIYDVSDPTAPALLATLVHPVTGFTPFYVHEVGTQRVLYILAWEDSNLGIQPEFQAYDVTDPADIVELEHTPPQLQTGSLNMTVGVVGSQLIAAVSEGGYWDTNPTPNVWHPGYLEMFDLTDPANIQALPIIETFDGIVSDLAIQEHYLFVAERSNPTQAPDGTWNNNGGGGDLRVYDFSAALDPVAPAAPEFKTVFDGGEIQGVEVLGNSVFYTHRWEGLKVITIDPLADPATWDRQWIYWFPNSTMDLKVASQDGKTLAWVVNDNLMRILDVTDPTDGNVSEVDSYHLPFYPDGAALSLNLPWMWINFWNNGLSGWWAAPTLDALVSAPDTTVDSSLDGVSYTFANENLRLWHTPVFAGNLPAAPAGLIPVNRAFTVKAFDPQTELPAELNADYTLTVSYDPDKLGAADEGSLKLYSWDGSAWVAEPAVLDRAAHTLTAHPDHFSDWSVMGADDGDLPSGTLSINAGDTYATSATVSLSLTASDATTSVTEMRFREDTGIWTDWESYAADKSFTLTGGDGTRIVSVEFRDEAGNVSAPASDSIILDTAAPTGSAVTINGGEFVNTTAVNLTPASTGAAQMRFSQDNTFAGVEWTAYSAAAQAFTLTGGDGLKTVYAQYRDAAGNVASASDTVTLDTAAPSGSALTIAGGEFVNTTAVNLTPASTGAAQMRFSEDSSFSAVVWTAYAAAAQPFTLSGGDGLKTVYAQYRDAAGNIAAIVSDTVTLDTQAPGGMIVINGGSAMTNQAALTLAVSSAEDVTQMRFMQTDGPWIPGWSDGAAFAPSANFNLSGADGNYTVYAQFRDRAGNVSTATITDSIVLDTTAPVGAGSIQIDGGAAYATQTAVWLTLTPTDALSGVSQMRISNDSAGTGASWTAFSGFAPWTLDGAAGSKTVYVWYRDALGNQSGPFSDSITLDTSIPNGGITIASGAANTTSATVTLTLSNPGGETGFQMRLNNDVSALLAAGWESFTATRGSWSLGSGNGMKTVYAQFKDAAGNISPIYSDTIFFDSVAPTGALFINGKATLSNTAAIDLFITFTETGSGVVTMRVANSAGGLASATDQAYANPVAWSLPAGDGDKTVCVSLKDAAGNESAAICDTIKLDTTAPVGSLLINGGAAETSTRTVSLTLTASDTTSGMGFMMISNAADFAGAAWQPYTASLAWDLTESAGTKTVYVRYMDLAGNVTGATQQSIDYVDRYMIFLPAIRK